jgi:hypothetical protein
MEENEDSAGKLHVDKTCFLVVAFPVYYISLHLKEL